jgi:hypothetical protein
MRIRRGTFLLAAIGLAACDFPTEAPSWEQTWVVPAEGVVVSVAELLPAAVTLNPEGTAFRASLSPIQISTSLEEMCPACVAFEGMVAPKPEFSEVLGASSSLPAELVAAVLAGGALDVALSHTFSFDPLRPSADPGSQRGHIVIAVTSNGAIVARDSISGHDRAFPSGLALGTSLAIAPVTVTNTMDLEIRIYSPAGDDTQIRTADTLGVSMAATVLSISEATIQATQLELTPTTTSMNFDLDEEMIERVQRGALRLEVHNPFQMTGSLSLRFQMGQGAVERSMTVQPGTFSRRIEFSGPELRDILGAGDVDLIASGTIEASGGTLTLTPTQEMVLNASFELVILVGSL